MCGRGGRGPKATMEPEHKVASDADLGGRKRKNIVLPGGCFVAGKPLHPGAAGRPWSPVAALPLPLRPGLASAPHGRPCPVAGVFPCGFG